MGLFGKKDGKQDSLLQKIEFLPSDAIRDEWLMYLYPKTDINSKSILYVNPGQVAIAVHAGKIEHVFAGDSGNFALTTDNYPFLKNLVGKVYGGTVPYDMKIYFINATGFKVFKWGTPSPIRVRVTDPRIGGMTMRVQANGDYKLRLRYYQYFLDNVAGSIAPGSVIRWEEMREKLKGFMNNIIVASLSKEIKDAEAAGTFDFVNPKPSLLSVQDKIAASLTAKDGNGNPSQLEMMGFDLTGFNINDALVPDEDIQKYEALFAERNADVMISDVNIQNRLAKEQMRALNTAAGNEGQVGGMMGAGLGFGYGMGMMNNAANMQPGLNAMNNINQQNQQQQVMVRCPKCNSLCDQNAKFCNTCGNPLAQGPAGTCPKCGQPVAPGAKFCPSCGLNLGPKTCPKCGKELAPGAKFCATCGTKVEE